MEPEKKDVWEEKFEQIFDEGWTGDGDAPNIENIKSFIKTHFIPRAEVVEKIEEKKYKGQFAHDGDIYSPNEINKLFDDLLDLLTQ